MQAGGWADAQKDSWESQFLKAGALNQAPIKDLYHVQTLHDHR